MPTCVIAFPLEQGLFDCFLHAAPGHSDTHMVITFSIVLIKRVLQVEVRYLLGGVSPNSQANGNGSTFLWNNQPVIRTVPGLLQVFYFSQDIQVALNEKRSYEGGRHLSYDFSDYVYIYRRIPLVKV